MTVVTTVTGQSRSFISFSGLLPHPKKEWEVVRHTHTEWEAGRHTHREWEAGRHTQRVGGR